MVHGYVAVFQCALDVRDIYVSFEHIAKTLALGVIELNPLPVTNPASSMIWIGP
jgi:hypothetical protein